MGCFARSGKMPIIATAILLAAVSLVPLAAVSLVPLAAFAQEGTLQTIRDDVRQGPPPAASPPPATSSAEDSSHQQSSNATDSDWDLSDVGALIPLAGLLIASPAWGPVAALGDDYHTPGYYRWFPYADGGDGYLTRVDNWPITRPWAVRFDAEHVETFNHLENNGGRLLLSTTSRLGIDTSWNYLEEPIPTGRDHLWLGDANAVFRFAQNEQTEFRAGLGMNWLRDPGRADLGFNFTYGADFYPRRPWVVSAEIDCGTLGHAGLFRFRTTTGISLRNVEIYTGYEYADIGRTQWNALLGGLRLRF
jgi:hypothetical protein